MGLDVDVVHNAVVEVVLVAAASIGSHVSSRLRFGGAPVALVVVFLNAFADESGLLSQLFDAAIG